jgi:pimeloyl-ACP methyl ester carboxylesterase
MRTGRRADMWDIYSNLRVPVLVVRGEKSNDLPRETFDLMLKRLPSAKGEEIAGAGHWVHFDQPDAFIQVLKEFFLSLPGIRL